ncbi:hypothetical protein E4U61_003375 [Claviceps capensis]|nr:hypothetical protein E4U61_003375 [Claviceps capensis]
MRERRRLRCFGHIINFCAGAFTRGYFVNDKAVEDDEWKEKGALGTMSSLRKQRFAQTKVGGKEDHLEFIEANGTRWNYFYQAAHRFVVLEKRISKSWQEWQTPLRAENSTPDLLTSEDWKELRSTHTALKVFDDATLAVEGHKTFLSNWLSVMDELLDFINNVKTELEKRRDKYLASVWDQEYRRIESTALRAVQVEVLPSFNKTFGMFPRPPSDRHGACGQVSQQNVDHFRRYLEEDPSPWVEDAEFDLIDYWLRRRVTQPQLSQDEKDVRILEKEALCGAQKYEYSGDAGVFDEVIDDDEFHRPIFDDSERGME